MTVLQTVFSKVFKGFQVALPNYYPKRALTHRREYERIQT